MLEPDPADPERAADQEGKAVGAGAKYSAMLPQKAQRLVFRRAVKPDDLRFFHFFAQMKARGRIFCWKNRVVGDIIILYFYFVLIPSYTRSTSCESTTPSWFTS